MRLPPLPASRPAELARAWNSRFPQDYWWRQKYNVPFGSPQHLATSPWDIAMEYEQQRWVQQLREQAAAQAKQAKEGPPTSLFKTLGTAEYTSQAELDADFEHLLANLDADYGPVTPPDSTPAQPQEDETGTADLDED